MIVCPACGKENAENFNFCLDCGNDLRRAATAPAVVAPPPPEPVYAPVTAGSSTPAPIALAPEPIPLAPEPIPLAAPAPIALASPAPAAAPSGMRPCGACATPNPVAFQFCGACGNRLMGEEPSAAPRGATMFMHVAPQVELPRARLVTIRPDGGEGMTFTLGAGETVAGRSQGVILFTEDPFVSPKHCRFYFQDGRLHVEDLGSLNGVFRKVRGDVELMPGDHLRLGRQLLRIEPMAPPAQASTDGTRMWGSPDPGYRARLLQLLEGGGIGEVFPLKAGDNLIGREQGDLTFPTDGFVSGRHGTVAIEGDHIRVRDLGSSNGTFLRLARATPVESGDFLLIGNQLLRVDFK